MQAEEIAAQIIRENRYLTLATGDTDGPWAAPLAYTVEPDFSLVFYTAQEARHTLHISRDERVAGAIFNSTLPSDTVDGIQFRGVCGAVADRELEAVMDRYFTASFPDAAARQRWSRPEADFTGSAPQKFFRIVFTELGKIDPQSTEVDRRITLDINLVRSAYFRTARS
jgi:uncharacterized protein YhbP (UPF0306 family)